MSLSTSDDQLDIVRDTIAQFCDPEGTERVVLGKPEHGATGGAYDGREVPVWFTCFKVISQDGRVHFENRGRAGATTEADRDFVDSWMQRYYLPYKKDLLACGPDLSWIKSMALDRVATPSGNRVSSEDVTLTELKVDWLYGVVTFGAQYEPTASCGIAPDKSLQVMGQVPQTRRPWIRPDGSKDASHGSYTEANQWQNTSGSPLGAKLSWMDHIVHTDVDFPLQKLRLTWDRSKGVAGYTAVYHHCLPDSRCASAGTQGRCSMSRKLIGQLEKD